MIKRIITEEQRDKLIEKRNETKLLKKLIKLLIKRGIIKKEDLEIG